MQQVLFKLIAHTYDGIKSRNTNGNVTGEVKRQQDTDPPATRGDS